MPLTIWVGDCSIASVNLLSFRALEIKTIKLYGYGKARGGVRVSLSVRILPLSNAAGREARCPSSINIQH